MKNAAVMAPSIPGPIILTLFDTVPLFPTRSVSQDKVGPLLDEFPSLGLDNSDVDAL